MAAQPTVYLIRIVPYKYCTVVHSRWVESPLPNPHRKGCRASKWSYWPHDHDHVDALRLQWCCSLDMGLSKHLDWTTERCLWGMLLMIYPVHKLLVLVFWWLTSRDDRFPGNPAVHEIDCLWWMINSESGACCLDYISFETFSEWKVTQWRYRHKPQLLQLSRSTESHICPGGYIGQQSSSRQHGRFCTRGRSGLPHPPMHQHWCETFPLLLIPAVGCIPDYLFLWLCSYVFLRKLSDRFNWTTFTYGHCL